MSLDTSGTEPITDCEVDEGVENVVAIDVYVVQAPVSLILNECVSKG